MKKLQQNKKKLYCILVQNWVKDTVYVPNTAGDGHVPLNICKNYNTFNKKKEYFIY